MTTTQLITFAAGTFSAEGSPAEGYYVNFYFKDPVGVTRRETLFDGLTRKEASDIVRGLTEARRKAASVIETYEDRLYA